MIKIDNVSFSYGMHKPRVLADFSLQLSEAGIYGLLGPNGAGKSTLLYLIMGMLKPTRGSITCDGVSTWKRSPDTLCDMFIVPEEFSLPQMQLKDFVTAQSALYPNFSMDIMDRCLREFGMTGAYNIGALSMGQKKKIFISFALACQTPVLLMDEPTNGLDIQAKAAFRTLVSQVVNPSQIVVISTHQVRDLEQLLDHILIMNRCQVLLNADVQDLQRQYAFFHNVAPAEADGALYTLQSPGGLNIMTDNLDPDQICTDTDLELLFSYMMMLNRPVEIPAAPRVDADGTTEAAMPSVPSVPETETPMPPVPKTDTTMPPVPESERANRNFDGARFGKFFRWFFTVNRGKLSGYSGIILAAMVLAQLITPILTFFSRYNYVWTDPQAVDPYWNGCFATSCLFAMIIVTLSGSMMFSTSMANKHTRLTMLGIPASALEKWLTQFLIFVVVANVLVVVSFIIGDLIRVGMSYILADHTDNIMAVIAHPKLWLHENFGQLRGMCMLVSAALCLQALFSLGASVWYRASYIKTMAFAVVMPFVLFMCAMLSAVMTFSMFKGSEDIMKYNAINNLSTNTLIDGFLVFWLLLTLIFYTLGYIRQRENGLNFRW